MMFSGAIALSLCLLNAALASPAPSGHGYLGNEPVGTRSAQDVVAQLNLTTNVEGGYYLQTFQDPALVPGTNRSFSTAIYYLLEGSTGSSLWHRVDAAEVWHYYAGAPLTLSLSHDDGSPVKTVTLGPDVFHGQQPQYAIEKWEWQSAKSLGNWTLVGTTGE